MAEYLSDKEQEERLKALIKKHGANALILILLSLSAFFGYQHWHKSQKDKLANANITYSALEKQSLQLNQSSLLAAENAENGKANTAKQQAFLSDVKKLVDTSPESVYALKALFLQAQYYVNQGNLDQAKKTLIQAAALDVGDKGLNAVAHLRLAQTELASNQPDAAMSALKKVTLKSFEASKQELLGDVYMHKNNSSAAKEAYQKAWEQLKARDESRVGLQLKMESLGLKPEAIKPPQIIDEKATQMAAMLANNS